MVNIWGGSWGAPPAGGGGGTALGPREPLLPLGAGSCSERFSMEEGSWMLRGAIHAMGKGKNKRS